MPERTPLLAGGRLLGAFGYASLGTDGWRVGQRIDFGGLADDAVAEGARQIERLPWWPDEPLAAGVDPYERPRRLAWLGTGTTPRRFLLHTIHAENDASNRPDNNFTECLVVERLDESVRPAPARLTSMGVEGEPQPENAAPVEVRPSQLWDLAHWVTPWGVAEVAAARPGGGSVAGLTRPDDVLEVILTDRTGQARLRSLLAAVHRALHRAPARPVLGFVDNLIWGAGLLDTVMSLLPERAAWDATFDLRSLGPAAGLAGRGLSGQPPALVNLYGIDHHGHAPATTTALNLTSDTDPEVLMAAVLDEEREDCPRCGQWYASVDRLLGQAVSLDPQQLNRQLRWLRESERRHVVRAPTAHPAALGAGVWTDPPAAPNDLGSVRIPQSPSSAPTAEARRSFGDSAEIPPGMDVEFADLDRFLARLRSGRVELASQADPHLTRRHLLHLWRWTRAYAGEQIAALESPPERGAGRGSDPLAGRKSTGGHRPRWPSQEGGSQRW